MERGCQGWGRRDSSGVGSVSETVGGSAGWGPVGTAFPAAQTVLVRLLEALSDGIAG